MDSLTTREYAELHGVSTDTVRRWIDEFLIYAEKIGNRFSIPADEPPPPFKDEFEERRDSITDDYGSRDEPDFEPSEPLAEEEPDEDEEEDFEEDEEEEEPDDCRDPEEFERKDLRKILATREDADDYAGDIPVPTLVFKRCSDGLFQVVIQY